MVGLFDKSRVNDMGFALETLSTKRNGISRNVANGDTPMYKSTKLVFSEVMAEYFEGGNYDQLELTRTHAKHMSINADDGLDPRTMVRFQNNPSTRTDGNDVNMDFEMSQLADTDIRYQLFTDLVGRKFTGLVDITKTQ